MFRDTDEPSPSDDDAMPGIKVGYARVSTSGQDVNAQREALQRLGVAPHRVYVDHGLTLGRQSRRQHHADWLPTRDPAGRSS